MNNGTIIDHTIASLSNNNPETQQEPEIILENAFKQYALHLLNSISEEDKEKAYDRIYGNYVYRSKPDVKKRAFDNAWEATIQTLKSKLK